MVCATHPILLQTSLATTGLRVEFVTPAPSNNRLEMEFASPVIAPSNNMLEIELCSSLVHLPLAATCLPGTSLVSRIRTACHALTHKMPPVDVVHY